MSTLKEQIASEQIAYGTKFRSVECVDIEDFQINADAGQKWYNEEESIMYYKAYDEELDSHFVWYTISGVIHII